jgi:NADPH-dependent 2,4-dienoyl-CoA reductase/sulfur reductase-like enzyme
LHPYVVIGSGAAGIAAAEGIRRLDTRSHIVVVGDDSAGYYSRPGLAYYLTGEIPERLLYPFNQGDFQRSKINLKHVRVRRILPKDHCLELSDGSGLYYKRLLIATGAAASRSPVPGTDLEGVVKLDNMEDARRILKFARRAHTGVVVGGGITALELVEGLIARGVKTHYLLRGDRYWSNVLDETESHIVERRLNEDKVNIHYRTELAEIVGKGGRVAGVRTKDGLEIKCEMVAIAIGVLPRKELAEAAGLKTERGIVVNECLQTNDPDIYAAGDVAQVYDPFTGKMVLDSLWGPARDQGRVAGTNMAGGKAIYHKELPFNVTRLANLTTTIIGMVGDGRDEDLSGIARGDSETWRELPDAIAAQTNFDVNHLRLLVGKESLMGAILMGNQTLSQPLQMLVRRKADITPIKDVLLQPRARLADIVAEFWSQWIGGRAEYAQQ